MATGGSPRRLPFGGDDIVYYRTLEDYRRLREAAEARQRFGVIGSGFVGSEIAAALSMHGKQVVMVSSRSSSASASSRATWQAS